MSAKSSSEDYPTFTEHENGVVGKYVNYIDYWILLI